MDRSIAQPRSVWDRLRRNGLVVTIALFIFGGIILPEAFKVVEAPWAVTWLPEPKLVGTWEGPIRARLGAEYRVFLNLRYADERGASREANNLGGTARVCTRTGRTYEYEVRGGSRWFSDNIEVQLVYGDPKLSGLGFALIGPWNGAPLKLKASDNPFDPDGVYRPETPSSTADPDDSFLPTELRPGSLADFESACRRLANGG